MPIASAAALVDILRQSGVLQPAQIDKIASSVQEQPRTADQLARELVGQGALTTYQAEQLLRGRAADLALGPYVILERVGKGQMGHVFRARHRQRGDVVAVKVIRQDLRADLKVLQRFRREVRAISRLAHPNLIRARDVEEVGNAHFYAMEYVAGVDVDELIEQVGKVPIAPACDYIRQAALGLQHAHEHGLIHRDIKPANLLIARPAARQPGAGILAPAARPGHWGTVKLLDLGLALLQRPATDSAAPPDLTAAGFTLGTADYMAPEQVARPHDVDIRADIYGLGCTFYHMLAGQPPFPDGELIVKLSKHRVEEPTRLEELRPEVPPALAGVLRKMMAKRPEARYQKPADVAQALATILTRLDASLLAADWQPPGAAAAPTRNRVSAVLTTETPSISLWVVGLCLVILVGSFLAFWLLWK
jgi:eukaryotic-like serine/threonine-protein kinase